jgi:tryptophanase
VDIKYFDTIKKYYEQKTTVFIDVYMAQRLADNHVKVDYKINFQKTEEMKKP